MTFQRLRKGQRIPQTEYEKITQGLEELQNPDYKDLISVPPIYGVPNAAGPLRGVFVTTTAHSSSTDEAPVLNVVKCPTTYPRALATNGEFPLVNGESTAIQFVKVGVPFKVAVSGTGFTVGGYCGCVKDSFYVHSTGRNMMCLSAPFTDGGFSYIWAVLLNVRAPLVHLKSPAGGIPPRSSLVMGSATDVPVYNVSSNGTKTLSSRTETVYNDAPTAVESNTDIIASENEDGLLVVIFEACPA